jgi:hypothetical protein
VLGDGWSLLGVELVERAIRGEAFATKLLRSRASALKRQPTSA